MCQISKQMNSSPCSNEVKSVIHRLRLFNGMAIAFYSLESVAISAILKRWKIQEADRKASFPQRSKLINNIYLLPHSLRPLPIRAHILVCGLIHDISLSKTIHVRISNIVFASCQSMHSYKTNPPDWSGLLLCVPQGAAVTQTASI